MIQVAFGHLRNQRFHMFFLYQVNGTSTKPSSHHSGAEYCWHLPHLGDQVIELRTAYLIQFTEAMMCLEHLLSKSFHIIPTVKSLRDADISMLDKYVLGEDITIYQRCRYVVEENQRLLEACLYLKKGDIGALVKKMFETHEGLSKQYEVSCRELDFLVEAVKNNPAVLGARMMGGGFGGCTINLVREENIEELIDSISITYHEAMKLDLSVYVAKIESGTGLME